MSLVSDADGHPDNYGCRERKLKNGSPCKSDDRCCSNFCGGVGCATRANYGDVVQSIKMVIEEW